MVGYAQFDVLKLSKSASKIDYTLIRIPEKLQLNARHHKYEWYQIPKSKINGSLPPLETINNGTGICLRIVLRNVNDT